MPGFYHYHRVRLPNNLYALSANENHIRVFNKEDKLINEIKLDKSSQVHDMCYFKKAGLLAVVASSNRTKLLFYSPLEPTLKTYISDYSAIDALLATEEELIVSAKGNLHILNSDFQFNRGITTTNHEVNELAVAGNYLFCIIYNLSKTVPTFTISQFDYFTTKFIRNLEIDHSAKPKGATYHIGTLTEGMMFFANATLSGIEVDVYDQKTGEKRNKIQVTKEPVARSLIFSLPKGEIAVYNENEAYYSRRNIKKIPTVKVFRPLDQKPIFNCVSDILWSKEDVRLFIAREESNKHKQFISQTLLSFHPDIPSSSSKPFFSRFKNFVSQPLLFFSPSKPLDPFFSQSIVDIITDYSVAEEDTEDTEMKPLKLN